MAPEQRDIDDRLVDVLLDYLETQNVESLLSIATNYRRLGNIEMELWCLEKAWEQLEGFSNGEGYIH